MIVGQGSIVLAVGAGVGYVDNFSLMYLFSFLSPSLWETARYRLKYCLKGPLNTKQPTNQPISFCSGSNHKVSGLVRSKVPKRDFAKTNFHPKAALLFWFFGGFRCGVIYRYPCYILI